MVRQKIKFTEKMKVDTLNLKDCQYNFTNSRKMVFLILTTLNTESCGHMVFPFILAASHVFHITRILRQINVKLFCSNREAQSPVCSVFLSLNPQTPKKSIFLVTFIIPITTPQFYFAHSQSSCPSTEKQFFPKNSAFISLQ